MSELKYTVIKNDEQYYEYCRINEKLALLDDNKYQDELELLDLLIEKYDEERCSFEEVDPVRLLKSFMEDHRLRAKDIAKIVGLTKGTVSKILNYQKGFSKETIRKLSVYFKVKQEAFNRSYSLKVPERNEIRKVS